MPDPSSNSVVNFGDLSKPVTTFIEKVADAVGGLYRPRQVRLLARAEADASVIAAKAQIEISDLERRAMRRLFAEEARKQENIESIADKATLLIEDTAKPEEMESDWVTNFFEKSRLISNEEMQVLWARVLAGEANNAGSFSKRTVNTLGSLSANEAQAFRKMLSVSWHISDSARYPLVFDLKDPVYSTASVDFDTLLHLESIGLLTRAELTGFGLTFPRRTVEIAYFMKLFLLTLPEKQPYQLDVGSVFFTEVGLELASVCESDPVEGFEEYVIKKWESKGVVYTPIKSQS